MGLTQVGPRNHVFSLLYEGQDSTNPFSAAKKWQIGDAAFCQITLDTCYKWHYTWWRKNQAVGHRVKTVVNI